MLPIRRRKQRAVLAVLALRAGEPVTPDRLVEDVWGETPPRTARHALENYVSELRRTLGRDAIRTEPAGYVLSVAPEQVDAMRLERLLDDDIGAAGPCGAAGKRARSHPRAAARGSRVRAVRADRRAAPPGAGAHGARGAGRAGDRARAPRGRRPRARGARTRASVPRAPARAPDARPVPIGAAGGRPRRLSGRTPRARRGPRHRPDRGAPGARAGDPPSGSLAPRSAAGERAPCCGAGRAPQQADAQDGDGGRRTDRERRRARRPAGARGAPRALRPLRRSRALGGRPARRRRARGVRAGHRRLRSYRSCARTTHSGRSVRPPSSGTGSVC